MQTLVNRENDITDVLDHDFTTQYDSFGTLETCELIPNGAEIPVSESNKLEYIRLLCEHRLRGRVEKQIEALKHGLGEIVPLKELRVFDEKELELLIGGVETIDVDDWYVVPELEENSRDAALTDHLIGRCCCTTGRNIQTIAASQLRIQSCSGSGRCACLLFCEIPPRPSPAQHQLISLSLRTRRLSSPGRSRLNLACCSLSPALLACR